ncbi:PA3371 family protein [Pseudomonas caspiana]|uniref:PA3371 family protein n=1 Tax=Pseudomonas caspiana TaxID=1451454 RepID=UPI0032EBDFFD
MSKSALSFITLALLAVVFDYQLPATAEGLSSAAKIAAGVFGVLFVVALVLGRRIKFDPVLR